MSFGRYMRLRRENNATVGGYTSSTALAVPLPLEGKAYKPCANIVCCRAKSYYSKTVSLLSSFQRGDLSLVGVDHCLRFVYCCDRGGNGIGVAVG